MDKLPLPDLIKSIMASKKMTAEDVALKRGVTKGTMSGAINKPSMGLKTLHEIFQAMDEDVTFVLSNGNKYTLEME